MGLDALDLHKRIRTYSLETASHQVSVFLLAVAGFVQHESGGDLVHCLLCGILLSGFHQGSRHSPLAWHKILSADCPFLKKADKDVQDGCTIADSHSVADYGGEMTTSFSSNIFRSDQHSEANRRKTYPCTKRLTACIAKMLSAFGFYFCWGDEGNKCAKCVFCGLHIDLEDIDFADENVAAFHHKKSKSCPLIKGDKTLNVPDMLQGAWVGDAPTHADQCLPWSTGQSSKDFAATMTYVSPEQRSDALDTPAVQTAMKYHNKEGVEAAVKSLLQKNKPITCTHIATEVKNQCPANQEKQFPVPELAPQVLREPKQFPDEGFVIPYPEANQTWLVDEQRDDKEVIGDAGTDGEPDGAPVGGEKWTMCISCNATDSLTPLPCGHLVYCGECIATDKAICTEYMMGEVAWTS